MAISIGGFVYATTLSYIFSLDQMHLFTLSDYPRLGLSPKAIFFCALFFFFSTDSYISSADETSFSRFLKISIYKLLGVGTFYVFTLFYVLSRTGQSVSETNSETFSTFAIIFVASIFFDGLRMLGIRRDVVGAGEMSLIAMLAASLLAAGYDAAQVLSSPMVDAQPRYLGEGLETHWRHVLATEKFEIFYDPHANVSIAVSAGDLRQVRYSRSQSKRQ